MNRDGKVSEVSASIAPRLRPSKKTLNGLISEITAMCQNDTSVIVLLNPDLLNIPGPGFLILDAALRKNQAILRKNISQVIGVYGPGLEPGWIEEDLQVLGIFAE